MNSTATLEPPYVPQAPDPELQPDEPPRRWRTRTKVLIRVGAVAVMAGGVVVLDLVTDQSHHSSRQFAGTVNVVDVDMSSGSLRVIGTNDPVVTVDVTTHGGLRSADHSETVDGDHLRLRSDCGLDVLAPSCGVDFVVHVPRHVSLVAQGDGVSVDLSGISGDADVSINGGDAHLQFVSSPHTVKARVNGGKIDVALPDDRTEYHVKARAEGGSTHVDVRTDPSADQLIDVKASGGSINVKYAKV